MRHNGVSLRFHCSKGFVLTTGKTGFYSSTPELKSGQPAISVDILGQKAVAPQSLFAPILLGEGYCIPPLENTYLMSTKLLSLHLEPDFRLPNIPIPPSQNSGKKWLCRNDFWGSKCIESRCTYLAECRYPRKVRTNRVVPFSKGH